MNHKLNFVTYVNNAIGSTNNALKAIKRRDYATAIAHSMVVSQSIINAIEAFSYLEVEVSKELERK